MTRGVFNPARTAWHITVGTYCSRLHGGDRPTVDRQHNTIGEPFIERDEDREQRERARARGEIILLTHEQRAFIEDKLPGICERGGWTYHICAAPGPPDEDHFHVLLDADPRVHGKDIRKWLKRWLTEALDEAFPACVEATDDATRNTRAARDSRAGACRPDAPDAGTTCLGSQRAHDDSQNAAHDGSQRAHNVSQNESRSDSQNAARPCGWWVEGGSTKPVKDALYFRRAFDYIARQRTTPAEEVAIKG